MRSTVLVPGQTVVVASLLLVRDEPHLVQIADMYDQQVILTIAASDGADPLVELPAIGEITILPEAVQALIEGRTYRYNIWTRDGSSLKLLFRGAITLENSIAPSGVDWATTFLAGLGQQAGLQSVVTLSAAEYAAIAVPNPQTVYLVGP